jgi:DNA-binding MarR family transcriptional regulator
MLERILRELVEGHVQSQTELANRLGVSEEMVEQMLADLQRMGYLTIEARGCDQNACANCPLTPEGCAAEQQLRGWILTERGRRAAQEHHA